MEEQVSFKQVISRGCGIDVHQKTAIATVGGTGMRPTTKEFGTTTSQLILLRDWLQEQQVTHVVMESTGVYWKPVFNVLEEAALQVWIVNARHVKYVPGHKTDRQDSAWLCKLLLAGLLKPSYIPPKEQRELRDLTRYRRQLIQHIAAQKNRIIRTLEDCNVKLSSVLSHANGAVGSRLIDLLVTGKPLSLEDVKGVYHRRLSASPEELFEACNGRVTEHHAFLLQEYRKDIAFTQAQVADVTARIREQLSPYDNALELLRQIPGISDQTSQDLVAEIGLDMGVFPTEGHLCSWAGVAPGNNESGGKKKADEPPTATAT